LIASGETFKEKAILVAAKMPRAREEDILASLTELARLTETAGDVVVEQVIERRDKIDSKTFIGSGQAEALKILADNLSADIVVFNENLSPSQQANLEDIIGAKVADRTGVILDIFARHARSREGVIQVELAQSRYRLPRLRGRGIELSRIGGGAGGGGIGTKGPGEQKLEIDRRRILARISHLKQELAKIAKTRQTQSKRRHSAGVYGVCLVGYTNAGKSTLLNRLTGADVYAEDQLFATLDSTTRKLPLPGDYNTVISDTVGFIRDLPHELIAAFRSTLDGVREADLLLHVVDAADPGWRDSVAAVESVLKEIGADEVKTLTVFNKIDKADAAETDRLKSEYREAVFLSAATGQGIGDLIEEIVRMKKEALNVAQNSHDAS
jgi:GTP-binding protein HflX